MKRSGAFLLLIIGSLILLMGSCKQEFSYRGSYFGDSVERVRQVEGEDGLADTFDGFENYELINYEREIFGDYEGTVTYFFEDEQLKHISNLISLFSEENKQKIEDIYESILMMMHCGEPSEESKDNKVYSAFWKKDDYGIVLFVTDSIVLTTYSMDCEGSKDFYKSQHISDLLRE